MSINCQFKRLLTVFLIVCSTNFLANTFYSPSKRFISGISAEKLYFLEDDTTEFDLNLFKSLMATEDLGFIGYHSEPQDIAVFQDIVKLMITEILKLKVRDDFMFLRVPGSNELNYESAQDFLSEYNQHTKEVVVTAQAIEQSNGRDFNVTNSNKLTPNEVEKARAVVRNFAEEPFDPTADALLKQDAKEIIDTDAKVQSALLSINFALYQTEFGYNPLTVYGYRYNITFNPSNSTTENLLKPIFTELGINHKYIKNTLNLASHYVDNKRGVIIKIQEKNFPYNQDAYSFIDRHGYTSHPYGMPLGNKLPSYYYYCYEIKDFPELKLVMSNKYSLNPNSRLSFERHSTMSVAKRAQYLQALRNYIKTLPVDAKKVKKYKQNLDQQWN